MSHSPLELVRHILDEIDFVLAELQDLDFDSFVRSGALKRAFVRSLEIMGEAAKKVPMEVREQSPDNGKRVTATFLRESGGYVYFERLDGSETKTRRSNLSDRDIAYLQNSLIWCD